MPVSETPSLLGPFIGHVTESTAKIWLHKATVEAGQSLTVRVTLHSSAEANDLLQTRNLELTYENLGADTAIFEGLESNRQYFYRLAHADGRPLDLEGLTSSELHFRTLPRHGFDDQLDFLLMSCHNPETATEDGFNGFAVWECIPRIIEQNRNVRFALLIGDQVYGDAVQERALKESDPRKRQELYLSVYRDYWSHIAYRRVLCSLPAVMMWDDHDITDGWGSSEASFTDEKSKEIRPEWRRLFESAKTVFERMQAARNPTMPASSSFDFCFLVGRAAFVVPDLRTNRNVRIPRIITPDQFETLKQWVQANRDRIDSLFFGSSVVFSHGDPGLDSFLVKNWGLVLRFMAWLLKKKAAFSKYITKFEANVGDLRDDLNDSWGAEVNAAQTDQVLDWLFELQNPQPGNKPINVIILSGDIHTPGYSTIYSANPAHVRAIIPHIVSSPVAYEPFSWMMEALYRHLTKIVTLGAKGSYTAQVSHHYCHRNVAVVSLRQHGDAESHLKVKFYLEGYPEPETVLFDLNRGSHREAIHWPGPPKAIKAPVSV